MRKILIVIDMQNLDEMIENFDKALSHPDAADLDQLVAAAKQASTC